MSLLTGEAPGTGASVEGWRSFLKRLRVAASPSIGHFVVAGLAAGGLLLLHGPTVVSALLEENGEFKLAVLAPFGAAWLIWNRRNDLRTLPVRPWWPGLGVFVLALVVLLLGEFAGVNFWRHLALLATLYALLATALGLTIARALATPVLFLLFAANVFFPLVPFLMQASAQIGVHALRLTGLPAQLSALTISSPAGRWQITEACSGLEYVLIFAMAASLYASLAFRSTARKMLFVAGAVLAAVLANGLRFLALVYAAYLRGGVDLDHSPIGYVTFALAFALLFLIGHRLSEPSPEMPVRQTTHLLGEPGAFERSAMAALAALAIAGLAAPATAGLGPHWQRQASFDGCRQIGQATVQRDGPPAVQTRTQCDGPSGRKQLPGIAKTLLLQALPQATLVSGERSIGDAGRFGAIRASTLTSLDAKVPYRLTYWYEIADTATGSWEALKWHLALALLINRDASVSVVTELQELDASH